MSFSGPFATPSVPDGCSGLHWSAAYVGRPWSARDHCWALIERAFAARGIALPDYGARFSAALAGEAKAALFDPIADWPWASVPEGAEREFDVAIFTRAGIADHAGIVVEPGAMLHVVEGGLSSIESYRGGRWKRRLAGIYRHEQLT